MDTSKFGFARCALAVALSTAFFTAPIAAQAAPKQQRVVVVYKAGAESAARAAISRAGGRVVLDLTEVSALAVRLPSSAVAQLQSDPSFESVEEDALRYAMGTPARSQRKAVQAASSEQVPYGIPMVQADQVSFNPAAKVEVCIIDSGFDITHEDLQHSNVSGVNYSGSGDWSTDTVHHGTHVAGTVAALGGNGVGVVGVVPTGQLKLYIAKVFGEEGSASSSTIIKGVLACARTNGKKPVVVSMSLGGGREMLFERNVYQRLSDKGILVIAAAGNAGDTTTSFPAGYPSVMSVAALDKNMAHAGFSQSNADVEISAPGVGVLSTVPMGSGREWTVAVGGSSYAVQPVAGSPEATVSAPLADFGLGDTVTPGAMDGKVCLISRGNISFADKVLNCQSSGGLGAVIYNNTTGDLFATLGETVTTIPSVGATQADGLSMLGTVGSTAALSFNVTNYAVFDGTSMATPHVSAVAALVWSNYPGCTNEQIRSTLTKSALDLGAPGRDDQFGAGLVQAKAAVDRIASLGCGN